MITDADLRNSWPDLAIVVAELRRIERSEVADQLVGAVSIASSSSEILGGVGVVLRDRRALRTRLSEPGKRAWNLVIADVHRAYPLSRLREWWARWIGR